MFSNLHVSRDYPELGTIQQYPESKELLRATIVHFLVEPAVTLDVFQA